MKNNKQLSGHTNGDPIKGAKIKQLGYKTSIHALPDFIRDKVDSLLLVGESPASVIDLLSEKYPKLNLPSQSALYNYKKRYLLQSENPEESLDQINIKNVAVEHLKRYLAFDLPTIRNQWVKSLSKDENSTKLSKQYLEAVKLSMDLIQRLNIPLDDSDLMNKDDENESVDEIMDRESHSEQILGIIERYGPQLAVVAGKRVVIKDIPAKQT